MTFTPKQYAAALHQAVFESKPSDQEKILENFAMILKENGDLGFFPEIESEFYKYEREAKGIRLAEVTAARELSKTEEQRVIEELNEYVGGKVELKKQIDEGLLGGIVVRLDDELIDGSVKKKLQDLKNTLIK